MLDLVRELQAIAQAGLTYAGDPFDRQRYERLRAMAFELMAAVSDPKTQEFEAFFLPETGYPTPKVDLRAAVFRENDILLVREASDGCWTLPGGWADVNEAPSEGIEREVLEESGYQVKARHLIAVKDRAKHAYRPPYPFSIYKIFFDCELLGGEPVTNHEISDVRFFARRSLPQLSESRVLFEDIEMIYRAKADGLAATIFD